MKQRSLKVNAFLNSLRNILTLIFPLITFPYISRVLSVKGIGKYSFSNSIISYFTLIASLGINSYAIREGAKYRDNKKKIQQFANEVFTINVFSTLFSYILLFICLLTFSRLHEYFVCILIYSIEIGFYVLSVDWLFTIYEDFMYITIRSIAFQVLSIILLFIFVRHSNDYLNYAAVSVFSAVGSNILNFYKAKKLIGIRMIFHFNWKKHLVPIFILFAANIANLIYVNSDITILGLMKSNYIVGIYNTSSRIYLILRNGLIAVLAVAVPRLAMLYGKKKIKEYKNILESLINVLILITLPIMFGLYMLGKQVILIIAGSHFLRSVSSLRILTIAYIFIVLSEVLTECVLIPAKKEKYILYSMSISASINILLNILLIPSFSENAAAFSTVLSELLMLIINFHYSKPLLKGMINFYSMGLNSIESLIGCFGIVIVCLIVDNVFNSLIMITILSITMSIIIYILILLIFKNIYVISIVKGNLRIL